jgi:hypothetical protein
MCLLLGCAVGWLGGAGLHPETAVVAAGSAVLAGLILHPSRWRRLVVVVAVAGVVAAALAWPTLGVIRVSDRGQLDERPNRTPLPLPVRLMAAQQLLVPAVHGHPGRDDWRAPYPHAPAATGVGGVALALVAAGGVCRRHRRLLLAAVASLAVAAVLAYRVPPLDALLVLVPPLDRMNLVRFAVLVPWGLAVIAALAVHGVEHGRWRRGLWRWLPPAVMVGVAAAARCWSLSVVSCALVLLSLALAATVAALGRRTRWLAPAAALELALLAVGINPVAAAADRLPRPGLVIALQGAVQGSPGRIIGLDGVLPPNLASRYGLADLRAFDPLRPVPFTDLMEGLGEPEPVLGGPLLRAPPGLCGAWSVRYLVARADRELPGWEPVWNGASTALWRNPLWLPEVRVARRTVAADGDDAWRLVTAPLFDHRSTAVVPADGPALAASRAELRTVASAPDRVVARVTCDAACLLVLARPWTPGWRAWIDGERGELVRSNLAGLGVVVPPGEHDVELSYHPWRW